MAALRAPRAHDTLRRRARARGAGGALASGAFYGSSGPVLHDVAVDGDDVEVRCSPARSVTLVSGRSEGAAVNAGRLGYRYVGEVLAEDDLGITHARLRKPFGAGYARIEVTDPVGKRAWTNPL